MITPSSSSLYRNLSLVGFLVAFLISLWMACPGVIAQEVPPARTAPQPASREAQPPKAEDSGTATAAYDKNLFRNPIPAEQLAFLNHFAGSPSGQIIRDKQYKKLMHTVIPDWMFHYGWDIRLPDALNKVVEGSKLPVEIREGRYVVVSGRNGPYLKGRGMMWIDVQEGIALGAFYFHPTNGEPTPTITVFSNQVQQDSLLMSQLPPAFAQELRQWSAESGIPPVTTRYFIGGVNKKVLLEHDEDYCAPEQIIACEEMNADAADTDLNAAYYLEQTNYATNATAWMIVGPDQVAWIQTRNNECGTGPDWLPCRIRLNREQIGVIVRRHTVAQNPRR